MLETVLDMLRDPDKKGQHQAMGWKMDFFNVDQLEIGSGVNYLTKSHVQDDWNPYWWR